MRSARGDVREPHRLVQKRPRRFVSTLLSIAVVELARNQRLREFRRRSIFEFCNNICQKRKSSGRAKPMNVYSVPLLVSLSNQGFVLGDDANAFLTAAESIDQPHVSESSSQRVDLERSTWRFAAGAGEFLGVKTNGGPAG